MEENNEYGNCWQDLVRRIDAENRFADAKIEEWRIEDEEKEREGIEGARNKENDQALICNNNSGSTGMKRKEYRGRKRTEKKKTGLEMRKTIMEENEVREVKRVIMEARKMVKHGKMRTIDRYFKVDDSDSE
jgi:hypothetical protein